MKTLEEFIQRLQDDPGFEQQAHAFDNGDDLIAFVKTEGYDFTLEQLMREFERGAASAAETSDLAPPVDATPYPPAGPNELELPSQSEVLSRQEHGASLCGTGSEDASREHPPERVQQSMVCIVPLDVSSASPPEPDKPKSPTPYEVVSSRKSTSPQHKRGINDFTREPPLDMTPQSNATLPLPEEEEPPTGLFRGGGGRHRGFSAQRLKPPSGEKT